MKSRRFYDDMLVNWRQVASGVSLCKLPSSYRLFRFLWITDTLSSCAREAWLILDFASYATVVHPMVRPAPAPVRAPGQRLTLEERQAIVDFIRESVEDNEPPPFLVTAEEFRVSESTVRRVWKAFNSERGIVPLRTGRPLTLWFVELVMKVARIGPAHRTVREIAAALGVYWSTYEYHHEKVMATLNSPTGIMETVHPRYDKKSLQKKDFLSLAESGILVSMYILTDEKLVDHLIHQGSAVEVRVLLDFAEALKRAGYSAAKKLHDAGIESAFTSTACSTRSCTSWTAGS